MAFAFRRLGAADEAVLEVLALEDADFDILGRGVSRKPLSAEAARVYLADVSVLHWVAEHEQRVVGHLQCSLLRKRADDSTEVLLYEIGVRAAYRRRGVGRGLMGALDAFMRAHACRDIWVLADNAGAVAFYRACGFTTSASLPTYMTRSLGAVPSRPSAQ